MDAATLVPPGPGAWELEATHMQRPISRWLSDLFGPNMERGFKEGTARYGALLSHLRGRRDRRLRLHVPKGTFDVQDATLNGTILRFILVPRNPANSPRAGEVVVDGKSFKGTIDGIAVTGTLKTSN